MRPRQFFVAAGLGLLIVLPFVVLEAVMTRGFAIAGFPVALFALLWLLALAFISLFLHMLRTPNAGSDGPITLAATVVLMVVIATVWSGIVFDQMPCFMGVPNCD